MTSFRSFAVVPAAGRSRRMGAPKLLLEVGGAAVIDRVLSAYRGSRVDQIVAVVHEEDRDLAERCRAAGATVLLPSPPPAEMKDSVLAALAHLTEQCAPSDRDAWLLAPADMPGLTTGVIDHLHELHAARLMAGSPCIILPTFGGRRGHPVLFPWPAAEAAGRLAADEGLNVLTGGEDVLEAPWPDPAILRDLDTPADLRRWDNRHGRP